MRQGFTLVEMALVLVIVGIVIGGLMVGQDMIKGAEIRAAIGQWEAYKSATSVFQDKYGALPGDINQDKAASLGLYDRSSVAPAGNGDGNGVLGYCGSNAVSGALTNQQSCERLLFWRDLHSVSLIADGVFQSATNTATAIAPEDLPLYFPKAQIGRGNYWLTYYTEGHNYFFLGGVSSVAANGEITASQLLTPFEAFVFDDKIDDSMPQTGAVRAYDATPPNLIEPTAPTAPAAGVCASNVGRNPYNQSTEVFANELACYFLRLEMQ